MNFAGSAWTNDEMTARCARESGSAFSSQECGEAAGWCNKMISDGKHESTSMADCGQSKMACENFMSGTFACVENSSAETPSGNMFNGEASAGSMGGPPPGVATAGMGGPPPGVATGGGGGSPYASAVPPSGGGDMKCMIAPGAIGAAHQAGFSKGYSSSCPGTPAQESPYMWPLRWSAWTDSQSMAYGSDDVVYHSKGKTFYMLDKNWKRSDTTYADGLLRSLGQGPCDGVDGDIQKEGCAKDEDNTLSTMIHRGGLMYFISWKEDEQNPVEAGETDASKIEECTVINLAVIGNIRPDWFLDKRGDDTDVQYLGDQHVYYADGTIPKLVKQWRKKDFASQYFVMGMMGNPANKLAKKTDAPEEDNMHWPLILNIPGEGFGDDILQVYRNHTILTDDDEDLFMLIENYQAIGGLCADIRGGGGPPTAQDEESYIPSDLEVDPLSWVSNEITFSPIWEVPVKQSADISSMAAPSGKSVTKPSDRVTVESCYDETTQSMDMSIHFHGVEAGSDGLLPWMSLGYRPSDLCAMTPPDGGVTPIVLVTQESEESMPKAHATSLLPEAKSFSDSAFTSMYTLAKPLADAGEYMDVSLEAPMVSTNMQMARTVSLGGEDTVSLHFKQSVEGKPEVMNLIYAIGMNSGLGFHKTRGCFQIQATSCSKTSSTESVGTDKFTIDINGQEEDVDASANLRSSASVVSVSVVLMLSIAAVTFGL